MPDARKPIPEAVPGGTVPLCPGLTIVTAVSQPEGDYESIKTVTSVGDRDMTIAYSSERSVDGLLQKVRTQRKVLLEDLASATLYVHHFHNRAALTIPASTAIGTSGAVLHALKTSGEAELALVEAVAASAPVDRSVTPNIYDYRMAERIRRVGSDPVMVEVTVNDTLVALPAIRARGDYIGDKADFFFLDDERNPLALRYRIGGDALDVIRIAFRCEGFPAGPGVEARSALERALLTSRRADVYSIYFSFNSDELREESESTLRELAELLERHPGWRLAIGGHTDNIGSEGYNLDLSRRRAAAVKAALVTRFGIDAGRLTTAGYGRSSPKDTNETLQGRARNRRVELVRQ